MLGSVILQYPSSSKALVVYSLCKENINRPKSIIVCNAQRSSDSIPKLEPFSRSRIDRRIPEPPFLKKCEDDLTEYCSTLEGDDSYSCWKAYFELKDLEKEMPKDEVEKFVRQTGGRKTLISCLHGITALDKKAKAKQNLVSKIKEEEVGNNPFPVPDGLPKTKEELEEEEKARMPDSPLTKMLRSMGRYLSQMEAALVSSYFNKEKQRAAEPKRNQQKSYPEAGPDGTGPETGVVEVL